MTDWFFDPDRVPSREEIPFPVPAVYGGQSFGDGSYVLRFSEFDSDRADAYLASLLATGYTVTRSYTLASNRHWLLEGASLSLYLSHYPAPGELRVSVETAGSSVAPPQNADDVSAAEGICPTLWQLPIDWKGSKMNGGMSYVLRLSDGSFFIIDGGYDTDVQADMLYEFLRETAGDAPIVVAGWFISHLHGDHYGCFLKFAPRYADKVDVKALYYNLPPHHPSFAFQNDFGVRVERDILAAAAHWSDIRIYRKLRTGMRFSHADMIADVLFTHEDLPTVEGINQNDTSTVLRISIAGQRILFPCDVMEPACRVIKAQIPPAELKADIVQFSHHGYEGATQELYDLASAPTVLWPMNIYGWQPGITAVFEYWMKIKGTRLQSMPNHYICNDAPYVKKIILGGEGIRELPLPYTPTGDKLVDHRAIHDAIAAREDAEK